MSAPTGPADVAYELGAGSDNPATPNLNVFGGAWAALQDFTGAWATNIVADIGAYGDVVATFFPVR